MVNDSTSSIVSQPGQQPELVRCLGTDVCYYMEKQIHGRLTILSYLLTPSMPPPHPPVFLHLRIKKPEKAKGQLKVLCVS